MEWQPIETAPTEQEVIVFHPIGGVSSSFYLNGRWYCMDGINRSFSWFIEPPTHWMPLPQPPKE